MFHNHYNNDLAETPTDALVPELLACRACLATDTKLYRLDGALKETYEYLMGIQLTTALVQRVDRVSHKLLLNFTLGFDPTIIHIIHEEEKNDSQHDNDENSDTQPESEKPEDIDDTDGLTDVLNDFEEITKTLNDDIHLSDNDFDDINGSPFIERGKNFNVEELFKGKAMNSELSDIITRAFKGKGKAVKKGITTTNNDKIGEHNKKGDKKTMGEDVDSESDIAKKALNDDTNSTFCDAEETLNANLNGNLTPDITLNDVSINTTDLNDTDSNLVETFNNFILDHDYVDEKFLLETGDPDFMKRNVISKKTDEESLLKEILPKMTKKDKKLLLKEIEAPDKREKIRKPIKNLSKLKEFNKRSKLKMKTDEIFKELTSSQLENDKSLNNDTASRPIVTKPELPTDEYKTESSKEFIKFGSDFNFRVFELTRDEQLEEMQKKREGVLYLGSPYKCVDCAKGFRSVSTYSNHLKVHEPSYGSFTCEICNWRHKTDGKRRRHQQLHQLKYCCTKCEFVARSREKAESHFKWHKGKTYECQYCGEVFGQLSTQLSHIRLRHPGACVACAVCGEACVGERGLLMHTRRRHPLLGNPALSLSWYCSLCRVQFRDPTAFHRHRAGHRCRSDLRPCAECGDNFDSDEALLQHRRRNHSDAHVQCHACGSWFTSAHSRQTHYERVHLNVRPLPAARPAPLPPALAARRDPPAPARRELKLKRHMCELCGKNYHSAAALSYHQRVHSGERPFACPRCPSSFAHNHSLQAHLRTHTGERPFRCSQCSRAFATNHNLARHKRTVHLGQKQYSRCSLCLKWFSSASAARMHVATAHNNRPWPRRPRQV